MGNHRAHTKDGGRGPEPSRASQASGYGKQDSERSLSLGRGAAGGDRSSGSSTTGRRFRVTNPLRAVDNCTPFRDDDQKRLFVNALHQHPMYSEVLQMLVATDKHGQARLRELAETPMGLEHPAGATAGFRCLGRVVVPLLDWITTVAASSTMSYAVNQIAAVVATVPRFLTRLQHAVDAALGDPAHAAAAVASPRRQGVSVQPNDWVGIVAPVAMFCFLVLERFPLTQLAEGDWKALFGLADVSIAVADTASKGDRSEAAMVAKRPPTVAAFPLAAHEQRLRRAVTPLAALFAIKRREEERAAKSRERIDADRHRRKFYPGLPSALGSVRAAAATPIDAQFPVGPGGHPGGPRHDNDHDEVRDVSVVPTAAEMLCSIPPYLPLPEAPPVARGGGSSPDEAAFPGISGGNPRRLIDLVYRLTREDWLAPLRDAIQAFVAKAVAAEGCPLDEIPSAGTHVEFPHGLSVYRNAWLGAVDFGRDSCVRVHITFKGPKKARRSSRSAARMLAAALERLEDGTLVCLARDLASATPFLAFGVIVRSDVKPSRRVPLAEDSSFDNPSIQLSPCGTTLGEWLGGILTPPGGGAGSSELLLLHSSAAPFFAYAPVLRALARLEAHLPFPSILASPPGCAAPPAPPAYLLNIPSKVRALNLNILVDDPARQSRALQAVDVLAGDNAWPAAKLRDRTSLNESQLTAMRAALSTSVCLLQGPPGTGKSFLSIRVVQLLSQRLDRLRRHERAHEQRAGNVRAGISRLVQPGGILVLSYTNHALDQLLLGLLERGFTKHGEIVRLGRQSENPHLASISMIQLVRARKGRQSRYQGDVDLGRHQKTVRQAAARLQVVRDARLTLGHGGIPAWCLLDKYLAGEYPGMHHSLKVHRKPSKQPALTGSAPGTESVAQSSQGDAPERTKEAGPSGSGDFRHRAMRKRSDVSHYFAWVRGEDLRLPLKSPRLVGSSQGVPDAPDSDEVLETLSRSANAWAFSAPTRQRLLDFWLRGVEADLLSAISSATAAVEADAAARLQNRNESILQVLRSAVIVGATTSKVADIQALITSWAPQVVVIEEAGEVLEAHSLACLHGRIEQLLLIGDHKQLRPKANVYELSVAGGRGYNMDVSLFERLVECSGYANVHQLHIQRRMRSSIAELVRDTIYPFLVDAPSVEAYPENVAGMGAPLYWWDHDDREDEKCRADGTAEDEALSHSNTAEARRVKALVQYLLLQGYCASQLVVLTGYTAQLRLLQDTLSTLTGVVTAERDQVEARCVNAEVARGKADVKGGDSAAVVAHAGSGSSLVRVSTVDAFQGEESDVVIVSMVRCNGHGGVGFLAVPNRINVLLSRARHGLYLIASRSTLTRRGDLPGVAMLTRVTELLARRGAIGRSLPLRCQPHGNASSVSSAQDFAVVAGDGGCAGECGFQLDCGHACPRRCHADDRDHVRSLALCRAPCMRIHPSSECTGSHPCPRPCGESCGPCRVKLRSVDLPCGHTRERVRCGDAAAGRLSCTTRVAVTAPLCGHSTTVPCEVARDGKHLTSVDYCEEPCGASLPCGHSCAAPCRRCRSVGAAQDDEVGPVTVTHGSCTRPCNAPRACGHECTRPCHDGQPCPPCDSPCERRCVHTACSLTCSEPCVPCLEACVWACPHLSSSSSRGEAPATVLLPAKSAAARALPMVRCAMPCGAPCDRLPCDRRCDLRLACGHRCPSVCGEVCPPASFCAECGESWQKLSSAVVDMLTLNTLGDVDLDVDPVLVLPCGHILPRSTLDEWMELSSAYSRSTVSGTWMEPRPLPTALSKLKGCPFCRRLAPGIRRYGRPHIKARLDAAADTHIRFFRRKLNALLQRLADARKAVTAAVAAAKAASTVDRSTVGSSFTTVKQCADCTLSRAVRKVEDIAEAAQQLARKAQWENPISRVFAAALVTVRRGEQAAAASSATDIADAVDVAGTGDAGATAAAKAAAQRRLQAIELPPPDLGVPCLAWMLAADAADVVATGAEAGAATSAVNMKDPLCKRETRENIRACGHPKQNVTARRDSAVAALIMAEGCLEEAEEVAALGRLPARATEILKRRTLLYERRVEVDFPIVVESSSSARVKAAKARQGDWLRRLDGVVGDLRASLAAYPSAEGTSWVADAVRRHEVLRRRVSGESTLSIAEKQSIFNALSMSPADVAGHMYRCPHGHAYMVGDCGMTNQVGRCPECGAAIGGTYRGPEAGNERDPSYAERPTHFGSRM